VAVARTANNPLAVFLYPDGKHIGIVPPWKSVMEIQPLVVLVNGKGNAFFIALCEKPPHPKWQCVIFHKLTNNERPSDNF
jgi:hypothetical protein